METQEKIYVIKELDNVNSLLNKIKADVDATKFGELVLMLEGVREKVKEFFIAHDNLLDLIKDFEIQTKSQESLIEKQENLLQQSRKAEYVHAEANFDNASQSLIEKLGGLF